MATKRKSAGSPRKAATASQPRQATASPTAATARPATSVVVTPGLPRVPLRPPLEQALDAFGRELRAALDRAQSEVAALRAEVAELRQRYEGHTHTYTRPTFGGGGHHWIELRFLQSYIDGEHPGHLNYGVWTHGKSTSDGSPEHQTTGPSD